MFTKEVLREAAVAGSKEVSYAFGKLAGSNVEVKTAVAEIVSYEFIENELSSEKGGSIITYAQLIEGVAGAALLTITREDTLILVDLLNRQEIGTTGILMDLDRSAIKETLNILSNSYLNALSKITGKKLIIGAPYLMPISHLEEIFKKLRKQISGGKNDLLLFKTELEITDRKIKAQLHVIFDEVLVKEIKSIK